MNARKVAFEALVRIDHQGAYANLVLAGLLRRSDLDPQDRRFVTQLVYGTTRMRRACDFLVDRFLFREIDDDVRTLLRLGAYQLHFLSTPDHAAVDATVSIAPKRVRGFTNAVLRKVATAPVEWPSEAVRLSYPDWLVDWVTRDHGVDDGLAMLERMNVEPAVHERADGYVQDLASQWVCEVVDPLPGDLVLDTCAAPGGKATLLAAGGARVIAADRRLNRARLVAANVASTACANVSVVVADGTASPYRRAAFDRVLVDAPCSGLGVLRRRADARWRIDAGSIDRLTSLQTRLVAAGADQVRPGGLLVYSVCTVTIAETIAVAATVDARFEPVEVAGAGASVGSRWRTWGSGGGLLLPQDHDTDGMAVFAWRRTG